MSAANFIIVVSQRSSDERRFLTLAACPALLLALVRRPVVLCAEERRRPTGVFIGAMACQVLHFSEEYTTRFYQQFPMVLGLSAWSSSFFLVFNLTWLAIWTAAVFGLRAGHPAAFFPTWFLAIASIANGIAHPRLSVRAGGYFPGLFTAPFVGIAGVLLWMRLMAITKPQNPGESE
jgi:hypothetical protein